MHVRTVRQAKIVGGIPAQPHEFPYQVNLRYYDDLLCGGSILSTLFILTAAHCVKYKLASRLSVVAGDHDHLVVEGDEQIRNISYIFMHEHYNWDSDENDIAILALSKPLEFNKFVGNISWPETSIEFSGMGTVTGWGKISETSTPSDVLQKLQVPIINRSECQRRYKKVKINVTENMLCGGDFEKDSCRGDSGGPLSCRLEGDAGKSVQCGIVSHGIGCGRRNFPGVYTDVSKYGDWITTTMSQFRLKNKCKLNRFYCPEDKKCIPRSQLCNRINDCSKGSDEQNCEQFTRSPPSHFRCSNGISIKDSWVCDQTDDCGDRSDEERCEKAPCTSTQFQCKVDGRCIEKSWLCDDDIDCEDASDESSCNNELIPGTSSPLDSNSDKDGSCEKGFFRCPGNRIRGTCIPERWVCDGEPDCRKGEDESETNCPLRNTNKPINAVGVDISTIASSTTSVPTSTTLRTFTRPQCSSTQMYCSSLNICIPQELICDGDEDCLRGEDEANCTTTTTSKPGRRPMSSGSGISFGTSSVINATKITTFPSFTPKPCRNSNYFQCKSGECILKDFVCDLDQDCEDGSDESQCTTKAPCSSFQWRCNSGDCIYHRFRCDQDMDCIDQSDEIGCRPKINNNCTSSEFACRSGDCLPLQFQCDTDEDCLPDGEDEQGCPEIVLED